MALPVSRSLCHEVSASSYLPGDAEASGGALGSFSVGSSGSAFHVAGQPSRAIVRGVSDQELVQQGLSPQQARRVAVQENLRMIIEASFERWGSIWIRAIIVLLIGIVGLLIWAQLSLISQGDAPCDQPLADLLHALNVLLALQAFQEEITRWLLCYDLGRDGPVQPFRVKVFKRALIVGALLWPFLGGWMLSRTKDCSPMLKSVVFAITVYYAIFALIGAILPGALLAVLVCLVRNRLVRLPRPANAAPEGLIDELERVPYDHDVFNDGLDVDGLLATCPVCLDDFGPNQDITRCHDSHVFHTDCLRHWLQSARTCPLCRVDLTELRPSVQP